MDNFRELNKDLLKEWFDYRDEDLGVLTTEDKLHPLHFDEFKKEIMKNVLYKNRKVSDTLFEDLYSDFMEYVCYCCEKYYMAGFKDVISLMSGLFYK